MDTVMYAHAQSWPVVLTQEDQPLSTLTGGKNGGLGGLQAGSSISTQLTAEPRILRPRTAVRGAGALTPQIQGLTNCGQAGQNQSTIENALFICQGTWVAQ